jgi:cell wall-associated NlpC family hydrolase
MTSRRARLGRGLAALILTFMTLGLTWVVATDRARASSALGTELGPDRQLGAGDWLQNGNYRLVMQTDGNLVLYGPTGPLWATHSNSPAAANAVLVNQGDGNLVIYTADRRSAVWASRTNGKGAGRLVMQSDGNVVLYNNAGQPTWTTYTNNGVSRLQASAAVAFARAQVGKEYRWGAEGPDAYDCSGLTMRAYASSGVSLGRTTYDQWKQGRAVSRAELQPGDLVFYRGQSHMAIYVGNDEVIEAPNKRLRVGYYAISRAGSIDGYRRVA